MNKPEWLQRIIEREGKATKGPWFTVDRFWLHRDADTYVISGHHDPHAGKLVFSEGGCNDDIEWAEIEANCEFAAQARTDIPTLLSALNKAYEAIEKAPHEALCPHRYFAPGRAVDPCKCWKQEALSFNAEEVKSNV